jgi:hypothetical protein
MIRRIRRSPFGESHCSEISGSTKSCHPRRSLRIRKYLRFSAGWLIQPAAVEFLRIIADGEIGPEMCHQISRSQRPWPKRIHTELTAVLGADSLGQVQKCHARVWPGEVSCNVQLRPGRFPVGLAHIRSACKRAWTVPFFHLPSCPSRMSQTPKRKITILSRPRKSGRWIKSL